MAHIAGYLRMSEKSKRMNSKGKEQFRFVPLSSSCVKAAYPNFCPTTTNILVTSAAASERKRAKKSFMPDLYALVSIVEDECKGDNWLGTIVEIIGECTDISSCAIALMHTRGLTDGNQSLLSRRPVSETSNQPQTVFKKAEKIKEVTKTPLVCDSDRVDLRAIEGEKNSKYTIFSVDPPGCLDIDDAVHIRAYEPTEQAELWPSVSHILGLNALSQTEKATAMEEITLYEVGVHIADVTSYIKNLPSPPYTATSKSSKATDTTNVSDHVMHQIASEALHRSFTVYLPEKQIPILPTYLSHDECSLRPGEDKLAMSCIITIACSSTGKSLNSRTLPGEDSAVPHRPYQVISSRFQKSMIRTAGAYTYDQVDTFLDNQAITAATATADVTTSTAVAKNTHTASIILEQNPDGIIVSIHTPSITKATAGAVESKESKTVAQGNLSGKALSSAVKYSLKLLRRLFPTQNSHEIVEQLMLLANTSAAEFLETQLSQSQLHSTSSSCSTTSSMLPSAYILRRQLPARFNASEIDTSEVGKLSTLSVEDSTSTAAMTAPTGRSSNFEGVPVDFTANPAEYLYCPVNNTTTATTTTAAIDPNSESSAVTPALTAVEKGHVSLGCRVYTHFTSPIRRYADQIVHALLSQLLLLQKQQLHRSTLPPPSPICCITDPWLVTFNSTTVAHINLKQKQHKKFQRNMKIVDFVFDQCAIAGKNEVTIKAEAVVLPFRFSDKHRGYKADLYILAPCEFLYPLRLHTAAQAQLFDVTFTENAVLLQSHQTKEIKALQVGQRILVDVHCSLSASTIRKKCRLTSPQITFG